MNGAVAGTIFEHFAGPPTAELLGWRLLSLDAAAGRIEIGFDGKPEFANPAGYVQGGLLTAMLDDAMGPVVAAHTNGASFPTTIDLQVQFLRPVRPGPVRVVARVVQLGKAIAFLEGELFDQNDRLAARATASAALVAFPTPSARQ